VEVAAGEDHGCGLRQGGSLWCWGANDEGQLGTGDGADSLTPTFVSTLAPVEQLATTHRHTCALYADGSLWCWGANEEGQLAQGDPFPGEGVDRPTPVRVGSEADWIAVDTGQGHTCAIRAPGSLWCWGRNLGGELGLGPDAAGQIRTPMQVGSETDWTEVRAGQNSTCGVRAGGQLWCFGRNAAAELGLGDMSTRFEPTRVGDADDWTAITLDTFHGCGLRDDGDMYCWGRNDEGQLGAGDNDVRLVPVRVASTTEWAAVSAGRFHTCARDVDGNVWCSGENDRGQLGNGTTERSDLFVQVAPAQ
jgi:alpha-tubulin suppressor-like RCC1 family protein